MARITSAETFDVRFPTSRDLDGSDAMTPDPDYSAAYLLIRTDAEDGHEGAGFVFTEGPGNDIEADTIASIAQRFIGRDVDDLLADMGSVWFELVHDGKLRWLGPEKGIMHMAIGAVVTALWDLKAKRAGLPLWQLISRMSPEEIVDLVDFRYLTDALTRDEALEILRAAEPGKAEREAELLASGYPAYTTTPGWLGYTDEKLARLCREAIDEGFPQIKLKVGRDLGDDKRRLSIARDVCGPDFPIAVDANQIWDVPEAIRWMKELAEFSPAWIEEPTSPDDILGHAEIARQIAPIRVATGEHIANRVVFKQLLQAGGTAVVQADSTRVAGINENLAILLLAAKFGVPVCPHAGGVGLCEAVQHVSMIDYVAITGTQEDRMIEYVDHLHEYFVDPVVISQGRYAAPTLPGASTQLVPGAFEPFLYPDGAEWARS